MNERRKGQHSAVHRLTQTRIDLALAWKDVEEHTTGEGKERAAWLIAQSLTVIKDIIDTDLGPKIIKGDENGKNY
jgi:hypothetical protein